MGFEMRGIRDSGRALRDSGKLSMTQKRFLPFWWRVVLQAAVLVLAAAWIYSPVYHGEFLWDDDILITENWMVQSESLGGLAAIWIEPDGMDYFPLTYTALWIQWMMFGDDPTGYHITSITLHALSGLLIWVLLAQLKLPGSWLAAVVFTVHPVCVESVAWISEIKNTLSLPLFLLSCMFWVQQDDHQQPIIRERWYGSSLLAFLLALLAKPTMVGLPLLTLLYAWWKRQKITRQDLWRMLPMLFQAFALGLITVWYQHERAIGGETIPIGGPLSRMAVAGMAIIFYLVKIIWPVGLMPIYPQWSVQSVEVWQLLPWVGLAVVGWFSWRHRSSWGRHVIMAGGFFLLMVAPVLGFVDMAFMRISWVADHFLYLPMIGPLAGLAAWGSHWLAGHASRFRWASRSLAIGTVGLLASLSFEAASHWQSSHALWTYSLSVNKQAWPAWMAVGDKEHGRENLAAAYHCYSQAVLLREEVSDTLHYREAVMEILLKQGEYSKALAVFDQFIENGLGVKSPSAKPAFDYRTVRTRALAEGLAEKLLLAGSDDEGLEIFYGSVLLRNGKKHQAKALFSRLVYQNPSCQPAQAGLAAASSGDE